MITLEEMVRLAETSSTEELVTMATAATDKLRKKGFDTCSIINAKSGKCPENCRWCAQSAHFRTAVAEYPLLGTGQILSAAEESGRHGIGRFSFVTSGRKLNDAEVRSLCDTAKEIRKKCRISLCVSAGLLGKGQFMMLREAGVERCHCNLETAPSFFGELCTTHTQEQKIETLRNAREAGMDICSGGIVGMGETERQRIELAFVLRDLNVSSVPINVLNPIKGTPLENRPPFTEDELLRTISLFRLILPDAHLRFAGGVARFSEETLLKAYRCGINAAIMGDMLTTRGTDISSNINIIRKAGYEL